MYVPAVLRKTVDETLGEGAGSGDLLGGPADPRAVEPGSSATSVKSVDLAYSGERSASPGPPPQTGPYTLNRRQYDYVSRAAPTRRHWLKDEAVSECGIDACHKKFNFFERRHHCRKCGGIFCKEHTSHYLYINHLAQFTTGGRGTLSRVCDKCIGEYNDFITHEFGAAFQPPLSRDLLPRPAFSKTDYRKEIFAPKMSGNVPMKLAQPDEENGAADQLVGSVPANWSWSSF
ncbi:FYVE-domain-containing protein [Metschnikowia bicuspidata var. bicuspidata NRRL YB-4993]|uniref:FYVE-domain-containing protein n=1 Tax=Metschnikowia bicuspidata var. bicuspidata NRRL YB-4993 TaxID=869754 RepID=A0A1A0HGX9_9ASCO|nr:FYVE-domain-containing protein [Metschnikowia bicuspidata var. bicuspidata NRRL YB-4993]OBA23137.1 FYVE-domain-containing protein [Metschnikowia bicuspidata var. bicuspidata NRRL YB-4993]